MIDKTFWEEAKRAWIITAPTGSSDMKTGFRAADSDLSQDPWEMEEDEEISFDQMDEDAVFQAILQGQDISGMAAGRSGSREDAEELKAAVPKKPTRPKLDEDAFEREMEKRTLTEFVEAGRLLMKCDLPEEMDSLYRELTQRMPVLQEAITKFESVYRTDMDPFYEYYIPEALQLTATYLEYLDAGISEEIVEDTEKEVVDAVKKLILAVNGKTDEIYKFAAIEIKAKAKALETLMSQGGFVDPDYKL